MTDLIDAVPGVSQAKLAVRGAIAVGILIAIASVGLYIWGLKNANDSLTNDVNRLTADNTQLQANVDTVKSNFKICQDSNITQELTINKLLLERQENVDAVAALAKAEKANEKTILTLKQKLAVLNADAANNGPLANNLKETIRSIQNKENLQ
jgi:chromosome segregation ATPase